MIKIIHALLLDYNHKLLCHFRNDYKVLMLEGKPYNFLGEFAEGNNACRMVRLYKLKLHLQERILVPISKRFGILALQCKWKTNPDHRDGM